ncbi:hypothetical protein DXG03_009100 [Asterophora parasitica]|uniref:Uncharacterized protein n=1 Tax=Asterophora parasitica TaxID=117018 RepID=A0A9P7KA04_9AGAR|nr:hypothetical protein DXG03_009100 [Asterophora parasitica]
MSALAQPQPQPPRRRPSIVEVIDVDLLDDAGSGGTRQPPVPSRRSVPVIYLSDSDDEQQPVQGSSTGQHRRRHQRLISPPPPPGAGAAIPPVPRLPRRYASFASFPPPAPAPAPVRPINEPFDFEELAAQEQEQAPIPIPHPNRHRRGHVPSMGLGGALISLNRDRARAQAEEERERERERNPAYVREFLGLTWRRLYNVFHPADGGVGEEEVPELPVWGWGDPAAGAGARFRGAGAEREDVSGGYRQEYTHPGGRPEGGFSFDFGVPETEVDEEPLRKKRKVKRKPVVIDLVADDSNSDNDLDSYSGFDPNVCRKGKGKQKASSFADMEFEELEELEEEAPSLRTLLVCARCLDPLVQGAALVGADRENRKVWALRCGHMIDGKCLAVLGAPSSSASGDVEGKGKGRAIEEDVDMYMHDDGEEAEDTGIRARLRSRASTSTSTSTFIDPAASSSTPTPTTSTTNKKRKRPPPKSKKPTPPRIEATHEWTCPVPSCGRVHASVKMSGNGGWVPEPENIVDFLSKGRGRGGRRKMWVGHGHGGVGEGVHGGRGAIAVFA